MEFVPLNAIERTLIKAMAAEISLQEFLQTFVSSEVVLPSATEVQSDGRGLSPLIYDKSGYQMVAIFTHLDRARHCESVAPYSLVLGGRDLLVRIPPGFGIVVNPGFLVGFDISPNSIGQIKQDFC
jgi:hypothetical protein